MIAFILASAVILLSITLTLALRRLDELIEEERTMHAKCMAHIAQYVGDEYAATVLEAAAHDWESAEEAHRLKVLARLKYRAGGKSMPAIWMEDRAALFRGKKDAAA